MLMIIMKSENMENVKLLILGNKNKWKTFEIATWKQIEKSIVQIKAHIFSSVTTMIILCGVQV